MRLTPADIHNAEFGKASLGRRGYDPDEVDTLLDDVTQEMIRLLEDNDALRNGLAPAAPGRAPEAELSALTAELDRAHQACGRAERDTRTARRQLDEAHRAAAVEAPRGGTPPGPVLAMARRAADDCLREAHERSRALLTEAQQRAGRTLREARHVADAIDRTAHRHQDEAAAGHAGIVRDIDELTRLAAGYHAALEHHLQHQGHLIDGTAGSASR